MSRHSHRATSGRIIHIRERERSSELIFVLDSKTKKKKKKKKTYLRTLIYTCPYNEFEPQF